MASKLISFTLDPEFVGGYATKRPPWDPSGLGELVYNRTYSRIKEDGTKERWVETITRVVNGCFSMQKDHIEASHLPWDEKAAQKSAKTMFNYMFEMKFLPPGRGLWAMGTDIIHLKKIYTALNNCAFVSTANIKDDGKKPFIFLMDLSMLGVGVGFNVDGAEKLDILEPAANNADNSNDFYIAMLDQTINNLEERITHEIAEYAASHNMTIEEATANPPWAISSYRSDIELYKAEKAANRTGERFVIEDTREGWVESLGVLLDNYFLGTTRVVFDYSQIRAEGLPLKIFGGVSSGFVPLMDLHIMVRNILEAQIGKPISARNIVDIMNLIGKAVVAGNVRRCLAEDTIVAMADGSFKAIQNIRKGDLVLATGGIKAEVKEIVFQGNQLCHKLTYKIKHNNEVEIKSIYCTDAHRIYAAKPEHDASVYQWMFYADLEVGDYLCTSSESSAKVIAKEVYREVNTYDISTTSGCFFANDILVHNTAEIALGPASREFLDLKNYGVNPERASFGWTSNNSVYYNPGMDLDEIADRIISNGEPGIFNLELARNVGRLDDKVKRKDGPRDPRVEGTNPCAEQSLESYEMCCLVEVFPAKCKNLTEFCDVVKCAYLYGKTVTLGRSHWTESNNVQLRNRRIGTSLSGITDFLATHSHQELADWCNRGYSEIMKADKAYSRAFAVGLSIKATSVKPSGCLAAETKVKTNFGTMTMAEIFDQFSNPEDIPPVEGVGRFITPKMDFRVYNEDNELVEVDALWFNGMDQVYEIETDEGILRCTPDHQFLTKRGWIAACNLQPDDELI